MLARCVASCGACISRRAPKIGSFFESRCVAKTLGICMAPLPEPSMMVIGTLLGIGGAYG
jgi:hypothetical protein